MAAPTKKTVKLFYDVDSPYTWFAFEADSHVLHTIPSDKDLVFCIGKYILPAKVHFFFIELGISYASIEQIRCELHNSDSEMYKLLRKWKEAEGKGATFQAILGAASSFGIDTSVMFDNIQQRHGHGSRKH